MDAQSGMDRKIKKKTNWLKWLLGILIVAGLVGSGIYQVFFRADGSKLNIDSRKIIISIVSDDVFQEYIPILGRVVPITTVYLDAIDGGRVEEKYVEAGAWVKEGDKIVRLSNINLVISVMQREEEYFNQSDNLHKVRLSLEQYRLNYSTLINDLDFQIRDEKRKYIPYEKLSKQDLISKNQYLAVKDRYEYLLEKRRLAAENYEQETRFRKVQIEQLEASLKRLDSNLDIIKERLDSLTIRAPINGQLTVLNVDVGGYKMPGERLGQINAMEKLKIQAGIDEHYISRVEKEGTGTFEFDGETHDIKISKIYPDVREGQFRVDLAFNGDLPEGIRIGQTLNIKLTLGDLDNAIIVPRGGFFQSTAGKWAYVVDTSGDFAVKRSIKLGRQNSEAFEVLEGLQPGERVITSNYDNFEDMDRLILK
jgi:HlyD family secretion protein